jgi:hypothetical protein
MWVWIEAVSERFSGLKSSVGCLDGLLRYRKITACDDVDVRRLICC